MNYSQYLVLCVPTHKFNNIKTFVLMLSILYVYIIFINCHVTKIYKIFDKYPTSKESE